MKRFLGAALFLCSSLQAQAPGDPSSTTTPAVKVTIPLAATDDHGNPVLDLSKDRLNVSDNGGIVEVTELRKTAELPLDLGIVLRASTSNFPQQQVAAVSLLQQASRADIDRSFVLTAGGNQPWPTTTLRWETDPISVAKSVQGLDRCTGVSDPFGLQFDSSGGCRGVKVRTDVSDGIFGVLWEMFESDPRPARRVVVLFREPWGNTSQSIVDTGIVTDNQSPKVVHGAFVTDDRLVRVISTAQRLGVLLYVIGVEDASSGPAGFKDRPYMPPTSASNVNERSTAYYEKLYAIGRYNIQRMAEETGGRVWWSTKRNYPDAVAGIIKALNGQYALTFLPNGGGAAPEAQRLNVTATRPDVHIFAPKAYFIPSP